MTEASVTSRFSVSSTVWVSESERSPTRESGMLIPRIFMSATSKDIFPSVTLGVIDSVARPLLISMSRVPVSSFVVTPVIWISPDRRSPAPPSSAAGSPPSSDMDFWRTASR